MSLNSSPIKESKCKYFPFEEMPLLVLATKLRYNFAPGRIWKPIAHQTAGLGCHQHYMMGTVLKPRDAIFPFMHKISKHWFESNCGTPYKALDEIINYQKQLKNIGLDCNYSFEDFEEGIYPIDCTRENLKKLTAEKLPKDLDDLIIWKNRMERFSLGRWHLYIIGENSD